MHQITPQDLVVGFVSLLLGAYICYEVYKLWRNSRNPDSLFGTRGFWLSTVTVIAVGALWLSLALLLALLLFVFFA